MTGKALEQYLEPQLVLSSGYSACKTSSHDKQTLHKRQKVLCCVSFLLTFSYLSNNETKATGTQQGTVFLG